MNFSSKTKNNLKIFVFCLIISFLFLMICSKSSFLYVINNWSDANCYFTIGKSMLSGKIYYLDLFDQKGPLLFFYHTIAALISYNSFIGVFLIEVISYAFFLYYAYKLLNLFLKENTCFYILPIISFLILTLPAFSYGDSAEEFCLPFLMFSLYELISFLKSNKNIPTYKMFLVNGIIAGLVFTIKYSLLGFWFGFMFLLFIWMVRKKEIKKTFISSFIFLGGMLIPIIPWLIYFSINNALDNFIFSYFIFNVKFYPKDLSIFSRIITIFNNPLRFFSSNLGVGIFFFFGVIMLIFDDVIFKKKEEKLIILFSFIFLIAGVFCGGIAFRYYYLILVPYILFGIIFFWKLLEDKYKIPKRKIVLISSVIIILCLTFYASPNAREMRHLVKKEDTVQYQFAKLIKQRKANPTLLNYHFLDGGFYLTTETVPTIKYFQKQNVDDKLFNDIKKVQDEAIRKKEVDFVITRTKINRYESFKFPKELKQNYHEIDRKNEEYEKNRYRYVLWEKN